MVDRSDRDVRESRIAAPKKVLIVDDSRVMRAWLRTVLSSDRRLEIIGEAADALEARDFLKARKADVLTLDIEMPGMSGLEFLTRLMRARPMPVVMLSSLTAEGSDAAIQALSLGAIDCMLKPTGGCDRDLSHDICDRVFHAACTRPSQIVAGNVFTKNAAPTGPKVKTPRDGPCRRGAIILMGASTGGVAAIEQVLPALDPSGPPVVIVQHMPGNFLKSFAERLDHHLPQHVKLAEEGIPLHRGDVILAPGIGMHTIVKRSANGWVCRFAECEADALHCPSVDRLFRSAVPEAEKVSAAILTGLGKDGALGLKELRESGAKTFGQNEETSVVYGMPRAAFALGAVQKQVSIERLGAVLASSFARRENPIAKEEARLS